VKKNKLVNIISIIALLLMIGGCKKSESVDRPLGLSSSPTPTSPIAVAPTITPTIALTSDPTTEPTTAPTTVPTTAPTASKRANELQAKDFEIIYKDVVVKLGVVPEEILDKLGQGGANENNNYGFVGWSPDNKYKYYSHEYESFDLYTRINVVEGTSVISQVNLNDIPTNRGIKKGNTYNDMINTYGQPMSANKDNGETYFEYKLKDKFIKFGVNDNKIIEDITLSFEL